MKKLLIFLFLLLVLPFINISECHANSAEPPSILIIVSNAPQDLKISIGQENIPATRINRATESYFSFYRYDLRSTDYKLQVTTDDEAFEITINSPLAQYNNVFTLDLKEKTLTPGKSLSRSFSLILLRILLTLILEAGVFYLFGYRKKRSWLVFMIANLITQGGLNIWLNQSFSPVDSYIILSLIFIEILVFFFEMITFLIFVNEHPRWRTALFVVGANFLSLVAGGFLITNLPI